ncbi:hypothetical protein M514_05794 [Trichuris suis]|uniref:Uncharacterized protein n=1 Tax=Trichuris suis TaxID=68888 RepID=A0A085M7W7_9BILA|nr:hypothetical protein M513_05794 [Trichuris suis]KFD66403.1 hypothetical protein M514_05794 [Trichuris suis]
MNSQQTSQRSVISDGRQFRFEAFSRLRAKPPPTLRNVNQVLKRDLLTKFNAIRKAEMITGLFSRKVKMCVVLNSCSNTIDSSDTTTLKQINLFAYASSAFLMCQQPRAE